jgi:hypothetical protein
MRGGVEIYNFGVPHTSYAIETIAKISHIITHNPQEQDHYGTSQCWSMGIEPHEQEGKATYSLQQEYHNSSCLCTKHNKGSKEFNLMLESKKNKI